MSAQFRLVRRAGIPYERSDGEAGITLLPECALASCARSRRPASDALLTSDRYARTIAYVWTWPTTRRRLSTESISQLALRSDR
jgi:hypothetical protein